MTNAYTEAIDKALDDFYHRVFEHAYELGQEPEAQVET